MYKFLFYCFYCGMFRGKSHDIKEASQSALTRLNWTVPFIVLSIYPLYHVITNQPINIPDLGLYPELIISLVLLTIYLPIIYINYSMFIKNDRCLLIVEKFNNKYPKSIRTLLGIFSIFLFFGSFMFFIVLLKLTPP